MKTLNWLCDRSWLFNSLLVIKSGVRESRSYDAPLVSGAMSDAMSGAMSDAVSDAMSGAMSERERNVLFNDALNTFYLRLYGVRHMVKDHPDSERGNPLSPHRLLLSINSKGYFICTIPQTG